MTDDALRQAILTCLGRFPQHVPLAPTFGVPEDMGDYTRTLVTYQVEEHERVPAWLLRPNGTAPQGGWSALLAIHQHAGQFELGKSEPAGLSGDEHYHYGLEVCRRGYIVLCPDQLCFEDRRPSEEARRTHRAFVDHNYENFELTRWLLKGACLQTKYLHDLVCALDLLASLPQVNNERLGALGHSLGGQEVLWLTWYDPRIKAAVSSCGFGLLSTYVRAGILHNRAAYVPGLLAHADLDALVAAIAPRPFLLTAGRADPLFPFDGVSAVISTAQEAYQRAGLAERFQAVVFDGGHSFPDEVKEQAYNFLDRCLKE